MFRNFYINQHIQLKAYVASGFKLKIRKRASAGVILKKVVIARAQKRLETTRSGMEFVENLFEKKYEEYLEKLEIVEEYEDESTFLDLENPEEYSSMYFLQ